MKHYNLVHAAERDFRFSCGVENCTRIYRNVRSYQLHLRMKHRDFYESHVQHHGQNNALANNIDTSYTETGDPLENQFERNAPQMLDIDVEDEAIADPQGERHYDVHHHLAVVMLNLREKFKVSEAACSFIAQHLQSRVLSCDKLLVPCFMSPPLQIVFGILSLQKQYLLEQSLIQSPTFG